MASAITSDEVPGAGRTLVFVCLAVLLATAPWFSGTAAIPVLRREWRLSDVQGAWLTIAVQLGFIAGTFLYAVLNISDVFNARRVFFLSSLMAAAFNSGFALLSSGLGAAVSFRFLTGVMLAGVYPVGMKIVAAWFTTGLGWRLGLMVGALTLGTASPFLVQAVGQGLTWQTLALAGSLWSALGGFLLLATVGDGPHLPRRAPFQPRTALALFRRPAFRYTAFAYFGHMWELYALWGLCIFYVSARLGAGPAPLAAFATVGAGALGCAAGGWVSRTIGERRVALGALVASGTMSALSGLAFRLPTPALVAYLIVWGILVVADSPQFSALAARYCPPEYTGTALTIQNGIGFAVTIATLQLVPWLAGRVGWRWAFVPLALGPVVGTFYLVRLGRLTTEQ